MKKDQKKQLISLFIILMFVGSGIAFAFISATPSSNEKIKAKLVLDIDGSRQEIPVSLASEVSVSDFLSRFGLAFNSTCFDEYCTDKGELTMYVNAEQNFEFEDYKINNKDIILINYFSNL